MQSKLFRWFTFGVVFSLLPFVFAAFQVFGTTPHPPFRFHLLWSRGELFLICTAFAADAIGEALLIVERLKRYRNGLIGLCVLVETCAAFGYGAMQSPSARFDPILINVASVGLFGLTLACATLCKVLAEVKP